MNNPGSMMIGWIALIAAGGGAYYLAKKEIDSRRRAQELARIRPTEKLEWWQKVQQYDQATANQTSSSSSSSGSNNRNTPP
ncbi:7712_t:CDS:2 [Ambispora gerdemannii]|uniref:7712_t:CDS:1 n=1 Tax=Ambispora gerdemannii TaxID=144530 RepID=A0A9N8YIW1_9GLOM|nr:7712_t:CDS:2 [Ambispora gerdemannii]